MSTVRDLPTSATTEMAKERSREAGERTITSWISVCTLLISFGITYEAIDRNAVPYVGGGAIVLGLALVVWAALVHRKQLQLLERPGLAAPASFLPFAFVVGAIIVFGLFAILAAVVKTF